MKPLPTKAQIASGDYEKWNRNDNFDKECLKQLGLPEDFHPDEEQAYWIVVAALED